MKKFLKNISYKRYLQCLGLLVLDIAFFTRTSAATVPAFVLIVGFILLALTIYLITYIVLSFIKLYGLPIKRKQRLSWYITGVMSMLVALQSIGELGSKDIIVVLPLAVIGYVYINYSGNNERKIT